MPNVVINGVKYHYEAKIPEHCEQVIIFVHGAGGSHRHWTRQVSELGNKYFTIAVDLPGHGDSEGSASSKIEEYSNFIYEFAEHVVGTRFYLAGHSMGGAIAMNYAVRFADKLNGLILIGTGARLRVATVILETFAAGNRFPQLMDFAYGRGAPSELINLARLEMENTDPNVYYNDFLACDNFDIMEQLKLIKTPTLILGASEDRMTPLKYSEFLAQNICNSILEKIDDAGHMMMLEKPEQVNTKIIQFIEKQFC
ncbi:alpha/beta hydrolase [Desulfallas sp. Bu1-1]|uniref:alpha/beta fold hydrolase n=1 Tax=Desulfallas sp. Bu1-1 TaxID=2787620 RepID=UPI00189EBE20|nr:alpha/beta hydrolase [Desulfallas sp. Bu1-1]MBF7083332.1 alpha/beta hydrolase [Desulfallas sp. Bu1-1]